MPKARKGIVQIRFEILEYLYYTPEVQPRTHIWRRATTLSYDDFLKHLLYLVEKGLVQTTESGDCEITSQGRKIYNSLRHVLFSIL